MLKLSERLRVHATLGIVSLDAETARYIARALDTMDDVGAMNDALVAEIKAMRRGIAWRTWAIVALEVALIVLVAV